MRRVSKGHGFLLSLIINMLFRPEWPIISIVLFIFHKTIGIKLWIALIPLVIWVVYPLIITLVLGWANSCGNSAPVVHENKNPYSSKNTLSTSPDRTMDKNPMCPCCNRYRLDEAGKYEICPICKWEDDPIQRANPDFEGGANKQSLNAARVAYNNRKAEE